MSLPARLRPLRLCFAAAAILVFGACAAPPKGPSSTGGAADGATRSEGAKDEEPIAEASPPGGSVRGVVPKDAPPPMAGKLYDVVVSFRSTGQGPDHQTRERVDALLDATQGLDRAHGRWGQEGESDECVDLGRMGASDKSALLTKLRGLVQTAKNTDLSERHECRHDFAVAEQRFELVVEFISPGNGTDPKAEEDLAKLTAAWPKVRHASYPWGREGEHNECFEFGSDQGARDAFFRGIKTTVAGSDRVRIHQNALCSVR